MHTETIGKKVVPRTPQVKELKNMTDLETSVVVVVKNRADEIEEVHASLVDGLGNDQNNYEIIFVDDGSVDHSWARLKKLAEDDLRVKVIRLRTSFGEAAAFDAGHKQSVGKNIVFFTTRVRINASQIARLLARLEQGADVVMGWRFPRRDSALNQFISKTFNAIIRWVSKNDLQDNNSGVFAVKRNVLLDIPLYGNLNIFLPILAARKGYRIEAEKIEQLPGAFRQSRYLTEYAQRLLDIVAVFFLTNYSKKPLHFLGFIGLLFTLAGVGLNAYLFFYRIFQYGPIAGRPLLFFGALLLVIGIQMISIGLIGEMIIFTHAKEIKEYTIEEILD